MESTDLIDKNIHKIECQVKLRPDSTDMIQRKRRKKKKKQKGERDLDDTTFLLNKKGKKRRCVEYKDLTLEVECEHDPYIMKKRKRKKNEVVGKYVTEAESYTSPSIQPKKKKHLQNCSNTNVYVEADIRKKHMDNRESNVTRNSYLQNNGIFNEIEASVDQNKNDISITCEHANTAKESKEDWFSGLHYIASTCRHSKYHKELEMLKNKGIVPKRGKWTADEIQQLKRNMIEFLACHEVKDYTRLIIPRSKEDRAFQKETQFILKMCCGIQRTRVKITQKIHSQFSDFLDRGRFSDIEIGEVVKLHRSGKMWRDIGIILNRSYTQLNSIFNSNTKSWNKGKWNEVEDSVLLKSVNEYLKNGKCISWVNISNVVGTRSSNSCYTRWHSKYIQSKQNERNDFIEKNTYNSNSNLLQNHNDIHDFTPADKCKLVSLVYESNVEDQDFIDWIEISTQFKNSSITPSFLKWQFGVLITEVPRYHMLEFGDMIEKIYEIYQNRQPS